MKRIVVYGLGKNYKRYRRAIEKRCQIVAHCDRNPEKIKEFTDGITVEALANNIANYDEIYVTASLLQVVPFLRNELHIPAEKIVAMETEPMAYGGGQGVSPCLQLYGGTKEAMVLQLLVRELGLTPSELKYIEIGTNDPVRGNNSYFLYAAGARGLLVDPMPVVAETAKIFRPEDRFLHAAVTDIEKKPTATFYESNTLSSSSLHENFQKDFAPSEKRHITKSYEVRLIGINELIKEAGDCPDILLIDAEGEDDTIVRGIDYDKYRPKIIMVEIDHCDEEALVRFMMGKGYLWYTTVDYTNAIFVNED